MGGSSSPPPKRPRRSTSGLVLGSAGREGPGGRPPVRGGQASLSESVHTNNISNVGGAWSEVVGSPRRAEVEAGGLGTGEQCRMVGASAQDSIRRAKVATSSSRHQAAAAASGSKHQQQHAATSSSSASGSSGSASGSSSSRHQAATQQQQQQQAATSGSGHQGSTKQQQSSTTMQQKQQQRQAATSSGRRQAVHTHNIRNVGGTQSQVAGVVRYDPRGTGVDSPRGVEVAGRVPTATQGSSRRAEVAAGVVGASAQGRVVGTSAQGSLRQQPKARSQAAGVVTQGSSRGAEVAAGVVGASAQGRVVGASAQGSPRQQPRAHRGAKGADVHTNKISNVGGTRSQAVGRVGANAHGRVVDASVQGSPRQQPKTKRGQEGPEVIDLVSPPRVRPPKQRRQLGTAMGPWMVSRGGAPPPLAPLQPSGHGRSSTANT